MSSLASLLMSVADVVAIVTYLNAGGRIGDTLRAVSNPFVESLSRSLIVE